MANSTYGSGTLFKRGNIWYLSYWVDGRQVQKSTRSAKLQDAKRLRDQILGRKSRGELYNFGVDRITCGELLDDFLIRAEVNSKPATVRIWRFVIEANIRPFFGHRKAVAVTTELLREYRRKRLSQGRSETTVNRELSLLRIAFNLGRKSTPPKVINVPYFPIVAEDNARQGFLTDEQYATLRDALPDDLKPLFVTAYFTGIRLGELLAIRWEQVDFDQSFIVLNAAETKAGHARAVPILLGDMEKWLRWAFENQSEECPFVFQREGIAIKSFRRSWARACKTAGVPDLKFHDLRRTAVRNMRRAGVSQVVRMKISGHRTDSMERRYNIVDVDDIKTAKALMERPREPERLKSERKSRTFRRR